MSGGLMCAQLHSEGGETDGSSTPARNNSPVSADIFTSVGVTAQFGLFQRLLLDHTKLGVRLDIGAASSLKGLTRGRHSESTEHHSDNLDFTVNEVLPDVSLSLQQQVINCSIPSYCSASIIT